MKLPPVSLNHCYAFSSTACDFSIRSIAFLVNTTAATCLTIRATAEYPIRTFCKNLSVKDAVVTLCITPVLVFGKLMQDNIDTSYRRELSKGFSHTAELFLGLVDKDLFKCNQST